MKALFQPFGLLGRIHKELGGRDLKINEAQPKGERPQRGNGGGRSGGGRSRGGFSHEDYRESARQPRW